MFQLNNGLNNNVTVLARLLIGDSSSKQSWCDAFVENRQRALQPAGIVTS